MDRDVDVVAGDAVQRAADHGVTEPQLDTRTTPTEVAEDERQPDPVDDAALGWELRDGREARSDLLAVQGERVDGGERRMQARSSRDGASPGMVSSPDIQSRPSTLARRSIHVPSDSDRRSGRA
ncbi:hypothetical protein BC477_19730 [Clavibacter michiganensis subsp. michiganensis]|uniref:Uncharacterized protein n=1 Tax=Clavibacter michiganensis subsp. michiganensis TaxID=33013 RepID=A0A251XCW6_CLAMM|nr:hypothetical protein BC477_19730 [Clavibacter michiganensis subsp. michiganensis]OUD99920.1 hypothetical protein CMMCAS07_19270 [Clavibacter michiganensis subsp. michiganensis]